MTDDPSDLIEESHRLVSVFGRWPSFHDAEVVRLSLDSAGPGGPTLEARIHVFAMTNRVGPEGRFVFENHTLVTLLFSGIALDRLQGFGPQNVLWALDLTAVEPGDHDGRRIAVRMSSSLGLESDFECESCRVTDVRPYEPT